MLLSKWWDLRDVVLLIDNCLGELLHQPWLRLGSGLDGRASKRKSKNRSARGNTSKESRNASVCGVSAHPWLNRDFGGI